MTESTGPHETIPSNFNFETRTYAPTTEQLKLSQEHDLTMLDKLLKALNENCTCGDDQCDMKIKGILNAIYILCGGETDYDRKDENAKGH